MFQRKSSVTLYPDEVVYASRVLSDAERLLSEMPEGPSKVRLRKIIVGMIMERVAEGRCFGLTEATVAQLCVEQATQVSPLFFRRG